MTRPAALGAGVDNIRQFAPAGDEAGGFFVFGQLVGKICLMPNFVVLGHIEHGVPRVKEIHGKSVAKLRKGG